MPYYVLPKNVDTPPPSANAPDTPDTTSWCSRTDGCSQCNDRWAALDNNATDLPPYASRTLAHEHCAPSTEHVVFVPSAHERQSWRRRERERFTRGTVVRVPWADCEPIEYAEHFAHLSLTQPGMIAYTKSEEHGVNDRQTIVRPGKYLTEYYADRLSKMAIDAFIADCQAINLTLQIARTADEIERVYIGGPRSCMGGSDAARMFKNNGLIGHPTRVYGDSDLGVAYFGPIDKASARCVVWPDKMIHSRIYGSDSTMSVMLRNAGYTYGSIQGAKVRAIEDSNYPYLMPYVDGIEYATLKRGFFVLDNSGPWQTACTSGYTSERQSTCANCGDHYDRDADTDPYCQDCDNNRWTCEECESTSFDSDAAYSVNDRTLCQSCYDDSASACVVCDRCYHEEEFSSRQRRERSANGTTDVCEACSETHTYCSECDEYFHNDDGCNCATEDETEAEETDVPTCAK